MPVSRRQARREAVFALYERDVTSGSVDDAWSSLRRREGRGPDAYTVGLVEAAVAGQDALDERIGACAEAWTIDRIAPLERSILRVAAVEIDAGLPVQVAVDEAVTLAKRYCSAAAPAFVNGILGCIADRARAGLAAEPR